MKEKIKYVTSGLTFRVIFGTILIIFLFEFMVSAVGYRQFTESLTQEYQDAAFRTANTATALIDADKIESYLNWGENDPEYRNILSGYFMPEAGCNICLCYFCGHKRLQSFPFCVQCRQCERFRYPLAGGI